MPQSAKLVRRTRLAAPLQRKLARVKLLLCDVDGVLTDATVNIGQDSETKRFHIRDGLGMQLLQRAGIRVGWISNRPSYATTQRATELKIDFLHQGIGDKVKSAEAILAKAGVRWAEVCYVGDDVVDLGALRRAGVGVSVADGIYEARIVADYVTSAAGGRGAVREVVELILRAQNHWPKIIEHFSR